MNFNSTLGLSVAPALLARALTHKSHPAAEDYERLEFLGDRVLNLSVAHLLFTQFPHYSEGELAKHHAALVREDTLATIGQTWQLEQHIKLGNSVKTEATLQPSILADVVEALLGATFLDQGFSATEKLIHTHWQPLVGRVKILDGKSALQEFLQAAGHPLPSYTVVEALGKDHNKTFTIEVSCSLGSASGTGTSKQKAAQNAAEQLLEKIQHDQ